MGYEPQVDDPIALGLDEEEELDEYDPADGPDRMYGDDD